MAVPPSYRSAPLHLVEKNSNTTSFPKDKEDWICLGLFSFGLSFHAIFFPESVEIDTLLSPSSFD